MSIPFEHHSLRHIAPRVAVLSLQGGDAHATVARILSDRFDFDARVVTESDPVQLGMEIRDTHALVLVGEPTSDNLQQPGIEEAVAAMVPIIAVCNDIVPGQELPPGISYAIDPALGPEHLATALCALIARQKEIHRLQFDAVTAVRHSGGLSSEIDTMQEELQLAASVQREFLPRVLPSIGGIDSAALWRPASYVSGDLYNVIRLDEHHLGIFVIDAVGHGVPAALLTLIVSRGMQTKDITPNSYRILSPNESLSRINLDMLSRATRTTRFATAIYCIIDTRSHRLTVASAGHPAMLRMKRGGLCEPIETQGGLLGVFEDEVFSEATIDLEPGDKLLFYTDGFEQAFPELGHDPSAPRLPNRRYLDVFNEFSQSATPSEFIAGINARLDEESSDFPQIDDLTLLCAGWSGDAPLDQSSAQAHRPRH